MSPRFLSPTAERSLRIGLLVAILLVVPSAGAQDLQAFAVDVAVAEPQQTTAGGCVTYDGTVRNTGQSPFPQQHAIQLAFSDPPADWRTEGTPTTRFDLAPGASGAFTYTLCPRDTAEDGTVARITVTATVTSDPRDPPASDSQDFSATLEQDGILGLDLPDAALYVALAAILGLFGVILLTRRRGTAGIVVSCPEPAKEVLPNRGTSFPIRVRNEGRSRDIVTLTTSPVPRGWDTFLPLVDIPLEPREEQTVWLSVKSPSDARPGDHVVVKVIARSTSGGVATAEIDTLTTVREPDQQATSPSAPPAPLPPEEETPLEEETEEERTVYGPEDEGPRPVAVKRRKSSR